MSENEAEQPQLPLLGVGPRLKAAREAAGISRAAIAERTRIAERLITAIEAGDWDALPARTYATGFTRSYARAVGLDEAEIVSGVRREMGLGDPAGQQPSIVAFEPGDPARVPGKRFAWWLALLALVIALGGYLVWRALYSPALSLPLPEESASAEAVVTTEVTAPAVLPSFAIEPSSAPAETTEQRPNPQPRAAPTREPQRHGTHSPPPSVQPVPAVPPPVQSAPQPATTPETSTVSD